MGIFMSLLSNENEWITKRWSLSSRKEESAAKKPSNLLNRHTYHGSVSRALMVHARYTWLRICVETQSVS